MITLNTIDKLAKLSRLEFSDEEKQQLKNELQDIVNFVSDLQDVNTDEISVDQDFADSETDLREDIPVKTFTPEQAVANAEVKEDGAFAVPPVIE